MADPPEGLRHLFAAVHMAGLFAAGFYEDLGEHCRCAAPENA